MISHPGPKEGAPEMTKPHLLGGRMAPSHEPSHRSRACLRKSRCTANLPLTAMSLRQGDDSWESFYLGDGRPPEVEHFLRQLYSVALFLQFPPPSKSPSPLKHLS